jgi:ribosomal protein S12 methylthiotransferase
MLKREGQFWLRFLYLYPDEMTDELMELMASDPRVCPYVDMPIQHVNDVILKSMRRKTSKAQILSVIHTLREKIPSIVIRTSLMVGFPGETQEQFEELVQFVKECPLDQVGIFKYSKEEESSSARMAGHLSEEVKQARFDRLAATQKEIVAQRNRRYVGQTLTVIVEGYHPDSEYLMRGRFYGQCPEIDGQVIINDGRLVKEFGKRYQVKITDAIEYDLVGGVVGEEKPARSKASRASRPLSLV